MVESHGIYIMKHLTETTEKYCMKYLTKGPEWVSLLQLI